MPICELDTLRLRSITSEHSQSSARTIINDNFQKIYDKLICIGQIAAKDLQDLIFPDNPQVGTQYVLQYNGSAYEVVESSTNPGTLYRIEVGTDIVVKENRQYIVHDHIYINGSLTLEGNSELVVL